MPSNQTVAQAMTTDGKSFLPSDNDFSNAGAGATETQFKKGGTSLALYLPGSNKLKNCPIKIRAWGRVKGGTTTNFTAAIYKGTSTTVASNTAIATTGAKAVNSASGNFLLEVSGVWDADSTFLQGLMKGHVNGTAVAQAIMTSVAMPAVAPSTEGTGLTITGLFSASDAANAAYLDGFEVIQD